MINKMLSNYYLRCDGEQLTALILWTNLSEIH